MVWYFWCPPPVDLFLVFWRRFGAESVAMFFCTCGIAGAFAKLDTEEEPYFNLVKMAVPYLDCSLYPACRTCFKDLFRHPVYLRIGTVDTD